MTSSRDFRDIRILIPGYSVEDLPSDLSEASASSLLNAFAVAWHPWILNRAANLPHAHQAESTELPTGQHIILVPECSEDWLAHDWKEHLSDTLSVVLDKRTGRSEWVEAVHQHFAADQPVIADDLLQDFFALGTCHLLVLRLSRRMHHYVDPDSHLLETEAFAAAEAAAAGNTELARDHLRRCFECLLDCREQFHPTNCFLLDVCLPSEQTATSELTTLVKESQAISLICSGDELKQHRDADADFAAATASAVSAGRLSLLTGQQHELRSSLNSLGAVYADIEAGCQTAKSLAPEASLHWARRRFGMTSSLPSLLTLFDFSSALHIVLDDGIYPDREYGQLEWQSADGSSIAAVSRIPMAIDGAASFLRFTDRMTESMQEDSTAVLLLARLPQLQSPWLNDLKVAADYAPVLGRFVTMTDFIEQTRGQTSPTRFNEGEYLSPYLIQSSVLKTESPVSSPALLHAARGHAESVGFLETLAAILKPQQAATTQLPVFEQQLGQEEARRLSLESSANDDAATQQQRLDAINDDISRAGTAVAEHIAELIPGSESSAKGLLLTNSLPWKRAVSFVWPEAWKLPATSDSLTATWQQKEIVHVEAELPPGGFVWVLEASDGVAAITPNKGKGKPLAEELLLRNQLFEVELSGKTGGIAAVSFHGQRGNRVSQQVAFRYENSKTITLDNEELVTSYASTRMVSSRIIATGPFKGSVETTCEIVNIVTDEVTARFRQTTTVERSSPRLHIRIVFDDVPEPPKGNPWMTYFAARFAWDNEAASIVRSCLGQAAGFRMERFEAPDYIEVADSDQRLLILPHGRPYHRRTGHRMLDSLLIVEGESDRTFDFTLEFDQAFPMRSACEVLQTPSILETTSRSPSGATSGWILGLSAKNVVCARTRVCRNTSGLPGDDVVSVNLLLQETEGRSASCLIRTARAPKSARQRKADGQTIKELPVTNKGIPIEFSRFQIKEVELTL